jgi:hypothetical protein
MEMIVKNYRAFPDSRPATISLDDGLLAFIGTNNAGKSSLIRLPYEIREMLVQVYQLGGPGRPAVRRSHWNQSNARYWLHSLTIGLRRKRFLRVRFSFQYPHWHSECL